MCVPSIGGPGTTARFAEHAAKRNREKSARYWRGEINPEMFEVAAYGRRRERTGRVHRGPADRSCKHGFEANDGSDSDSRSDALFFCAGRDVQNREHEDE